MTHESPEAAYVAWKDAERAWSDEAAKYVHAWFVDDAASFRKPEATTRETLDTLATLRRAADRAKDAYYSGTT